MTKVCAISFLLLAFLFAGFTRPIFAEDNKLVFQAKTREEAKSELKKTKIKYVYLVKFESYSEKLPFSPGDLDVEKIFSNANAEIWRVK